MNCQRALREDEAKFFAAVFVCSDCHFMAERLFTRARKELNQLLVVMKESIRLALIEGRLQFSNTVQVDEVSKKELIQNMMDLAEKVRNKSCQSTEPTQQSAPTKIVGGSVS